MNTHRKTRNAGGCGYLCSHSTFHARKRFSNRENRIRGAFCLPVLLSDFFSIGKLYPDCKVRIRGVPRNLHIHFRERKDRRNNTNKQNAPRMRVLRLVLFRRFLPSGKRSTPPASLLYICCIVSRDILSALLSALRHSAPAL